MTARLNRQCEDDKRRAADRPRVSYHQDPIKEHLFPGSSLLDTVDMDQRADICKAIQDTETTACDSGLADAYESSSKSILRDHMDIFRTSFSARLSAKHPPLDTELTTDSKPVKVHLRKYFQKKKELMLGLVSDFVTNGMAYPNPTCKWACAPLLVLKAGA